MDNRITPGSAAPSILFYVLRADVPDTIDDSEVGLTIGYLRTLENLPLAASYTSVGSIADLAAINSAHSAGGLIVVDAATGLHRLDLPSGAAAAGADGVKIEISATDADLVFVVPPIVLDADVQGVEEALALHDYEGKIWLDPANGTSGSTFGTHGTRSNPCLTWTQAVSLLSSSGFSKIVVLDYLDLSGETVSGTNHLILDDAGYVEAYDSTTFANGVGFIVEGRYEGAGVGIYGAVFSGSATVRFKNLEATYMEGAAVSGTLMAYVSGGTLHTIDNTGWTTTNITVHDVGFANTSTGRIAVDGGTSRIRNLRGVGIIEVRSSGTVMVDGAASLTIEGTGGSVLLRGEVSYSDSSGGLVTITRTGVTAKEVTLDTVDNEIDAANLAIADLQTDVDTVLSVQQTLDYDGAIWIDTSLGTNGSTFGTHGKQSKPCQTWANVALLLASSGFRTVIVSGISCQVTSQTFAGLVIILTRRDGLLTFQSGMAAADSFKIIGGRVNVTSLSMGFRTSLEIQDSTIVGTIGASGTLAEFYATRCLIGNTLALTSGFDVCRLTNCQGLGGNASVTTGGAATPVISGWDGGITINPAGGALQFSGRSQNLVVSGTSGSVLLNGDIRYSDASSGLVSIDASGVTAKESTQGDVTALGGSTQALTNLKTSSLAMQVGAVAVAGDDANTALAFDTDLPQEVDNYYGDDDGGLVVAFVAGATNQFQTRRVVASESIGTGNTRITVEAAFAAVPSDADAFMILGRITELS